MKKIVAIFAFLMVLVGCSNNNKITITNLAHDYIYFNFRAQKYDIASNTTLVISDIPNGTYTYSTTYWIPASAKTWGITGDAAGGSIPFEKKDTRVLLLYAATMSPEFDYQVNVTMSSTISSTSPTSP